MKHDNDSTEETQESNDEQQILEQILENKKIKKKLCCRRLVSPLVPSGESTLLGDKRMKCEVIHKKFYQAIYWDQNLFIRSWRGVYPVVPIVFPTLIWRLMFEPCQGALALILISFSESGGFRYSQHVNQKVLVDGGQFDQSATIGYSHRMSEERHVREIHCKHLSMACHSSEATTCRRHSCISRGGGPLVGEWIAVTRRRSRPLIQVGHSSVLVVSWRDDAKVLAGHE
eukprot:Gb_04182 [translate_table: standard]